MNAWFNLRPHRLAQEEQALTKFGVAYSIDESLKNKGILRLYMTIEGNNPFFGLPEGTQDINLVVVFPDSYPFFRPNVFAQEMSLPRHQNPIDKNLCLLPRPTEYWLPSTLLADLLRTQLWQVLVKGNITDPETIKQDETEQAEPISEYFAANENPILFNPPNIEIEDGQKDNLELIGEIKVGIPTNASFPSRMAVIDTLIYSTGTTNIASDIIISTFSKKISGLLYRIPEPPPANPKTAFPWLRKKLEEKREKFHLPGKAVALPNGSIRNIVGFCFPEEKEKGVWGNGWMFLVEGSFWVRDDQNNFRKDKPAIPIYYYARSSSTNQNLNSVRIPKLKPLAKMKIAIVGLGALGGFVAIELARNGIGTLTLLDHDIVEAATTVRWPLGLASAGTHKTESIARFIAENYPDTKVNCLNWRIGGCRVNAEGDQVIPQQLEEEIIEELFTDISLLIDATAELGIHNFLSMESKERGIPYLSLYASPGGYGGCIMRMIPKKGGCWMCMKYMQEEDSEMVPRLDEKGSAFQPPGCGDLTFTGASFDLQQISLAAVRLAISTLCSQEPDCYPEMDWDIAVLNLFDKEDKPIAPEWKVFQLPVHPKCPYCNDNE